MTSPTRSIPALLSLATILYPLRAGADEPPPLEVTIVAAPNAPEPLDSSRAASRVSEEKIREVAPGSLADALRGRAGVAVQQTTPGQGTVYVRGLSSRAVRQIVHELNSKGFGKVRIVLIPSKKNLADAISRAWDAEAPSAAHNMIATLSQHRRELRYAELRGDIGIHRTTRRDGQNVM